MLKFVNSLFPFFWHATSEAGNGEERMDPCIRSRGTSGDNRDVLPMLEHKERVEENDSC